MHTLDALWLVPIYPGVQAAWRVRRIALNIQRAAMGSDFEPSELSRADSELRQETKRLGVHVFLGLALLVSVLISPDCPTDLLARESRNLFITLTICIAWSNSLDVEKSRNAE